MLVRLKTGGFPGRMLSPSPLISKTLSKEQTRAFSPVTKLRRLPQGWRWRRTAPANRIGLRSSRCRLPKKLETHGEDKYR